MKSRFTDLLTTKKMPEESVSKSKKAKLAKPAVAQQKPAAAAPDETEVQEIIVRRAVGKRAKADYVQVSAYVQRAVHKRVKMALLDDGRDFSELVSDLLAEWLDKK